MQGPLAVCGALELESYGIAMGMDSTSATTLSVGGNLKTRDVNVQTGNVVIGGNYLTSRGTTYSGEWIYDSDARSLCVQDAISMQTTADTLWNLENQYGCLSPEVTGGSIVFDTSAKNPSTSDPITVFCVRSSSLARAHTIVINNANGLLFLYFDIFC